MYYKNDSGTVYYEVYGPENAPAIVFSHGVAMDHNTFDEQVKALKDKYRVIVWDMPFHGKSSEIDKKLQFSVVAADIIIGILDELNIRKAILVGLSLGSFVVQQAAHKYKERIIATVHLSGGALYPKYSPVFKALKPFMYLIKIYPDRMLYKAFAKHKALKKETHDYLMKTASSTGKSVIIHLTIEMFNDMVSGVPEPSEQPMLIVYGDSDLKFIKDMAVKWHVKTANSEIAMVKDAHHIANQDNPEEFNKAMIDFLEVIEKKH